MQSFTVPACVSSVTIEARGAGGGSVSTSCIANGGLGASMKGVFTTTPGQVLSILVGGVGQSNGSDAGGGGGSFVATGTVPLIVGGGGGGASNNVSSCGSNLNGLNATITTTATASGNGLSAGGANGTGGGASGGSGGGGGGFYFDGQAGSGNMNGAGKSFLNGGAGGTGFNNNHGGYGGGGCGWHTGGNGGGGGGYSGGATNSSSPYSAGGGGASYNSGTSQVNTAGAQAGNGVVIITYTTGLTYAATVTPNYGICTGGTATLTAVAGLTSYSWNTSATTSVTTVSPGSNTTYTVTGNTSTGCLMTGIVTVSVASSPPVISVTQSTNQICLGKTVTLTATGAYTHSWTGGVPNGQSFAPTTTNSYTVTGYNGCGNTSSVVTVTVAPLPITASTTSTVLCSGRASTLTAIGAATSYTWMPGNMHTASVNVAPIASTVYSLTASDGTCAGAATVSIQVDPNPTITIQASQTSSVCVNSPVTLTATGASSYTWAANGSNNAIETFSPTGPTAYSVSGTNSFGCVSTTAQIIFTQPSPIIGIVTSNTLVCPGDAAVLTATGNAASYGWSTQQTVNSITVNPVTPTGYTLVGLSTGSCVTTVATTVYVLSPTVSITGNTTVCDGDQVTLTAAGNEVSGFEWLGYIQLPVLTVTPAVNTVYTVAATSSSDAATCVENHTVQVNVNPNPTVTIVATKTAICKGETMTLTASGTPTLVWNNNSTNAAIVYTASGNNVTTNYSVTGTDANGCIGKATITMKSNPCTGLEKIEAMPSFMMYPNPAAQHVLLSAERNMDLTIYSETGQVIRLVKLNDENSRRETVRGLAPGLYFVAEDAGTIRYKLIIVN